MTVTSARPNLHVSHVGLIYKIISNNKKKKKGYNGSANKSTTEIKVS